MRLRAPDRPPGRTTVALLCFAALASCAAAAAIGSDGAAGEGSVSGVQKVIELLESMAAKAQAEKNAEETEYAKFKQFCDDTIASKTKELAEVSELIEVLSADIAKLEADIDRLQAKIAEFNQVIDKAKLDLKAAREQREKDHASYTAEVQDHAETSYALQRAIAVLQKQNYDRPQAEQALLQLSRNSALPADSRRTLAALVQLGDDYLSKKNPEAHGYEFQSGGIVELLKKMHLEFSQKQTEAEKEEMNSRMAHEMLAQDLTSTIDGAEGDIADRTAWLQEKKAEAAEKTRQLAVSTADRDATDTYLRELKVEAEEKGKSFQEKQGLRQEEIEVIHKATELLRSPDVLGSAKAHLPAAAALAQRGTALAQLRASPRPEAHEAQLRQALIGFLRGEGARLKSSRLGMLAERVSVSADPFVKVKKLIQDLITTLLKEEGQEIEHKGWCDTELGTNKITREKLQANTDKLTAQLEEGEAAVTSMSERLAVLSKEINELSAAMAEATTMREAERAKSEATIKDADAAQVAIASAKALLLEFYKKAATATALAQVGAPAPIQYDRIGNEEIKMGSEEWDSMANPNFKGEVDRGHKEGMQTFGKTYTGQQSEVGGVLAFLEVIASDFGRLEADTAASEQEAVDAYKEFMATSERAVAAKRKETELLEADRREEEAQIRTGTQDLKATQDQALAADRYYEKLKPTCVDTGITYEKRAKAREEEIQSLEEALRILKAED